MPETSRTNFIAVIPSYLIFFLPSLIPWPSYVLGPSVLSVSWYFPWKSSENRRTVSMDMCLIVKEERYSSIIVETLWLWCLFCWFKPIASSSYVEVYSESELLLPSRFSHVQLWDPIDGSPPGSTIPGLLQARTLEWVAISFSNAWKWKVKVKSLSRVWLFETPWTAAHQTPPSMGFSKQESGVGCHCPLCESENFYFFH